MARMASEFDMAAPRQSWFACRNATVRALLLVAAGSSLLVACGQTAPTTSTEAPSTATQATVPVVTATTADASPKAQATGTPDDASMTFGALADRIDTAWSDVRSYQAVFRSPVTSRGLAQSDAASPAPEQSPASSTTASPVASPVGNLRSAEPGTPTSENAYVVNRDVVVSDRFRQEVAGSGPDDYEAIVITDAVYIRGPLALRLDPGATMNDWLVFPRATLAAESESSPVLAGLAAAPTAPLANLRRGLRPQELRDLGEKSVNGRSCQAFGGADTTSTGTRQDITIAIDGTDLPCSIETRVGTVLVSQIIYSGFNEPLTIEPPAAATPYTEGLAPATPIARD